MHVWWIGLSALVMVTGLATRGHAYQVVDVVDGGSITGAIRYKGTPPTPARIKITKDQAATIDAEANPPFSIAQPESRRVVEKKIERAEMPIRVRCDVHPWMGAWWISQEHPYYALTDHNGTFVLDDVPPGNHRIEAWHEALGALTADVVVKPKDVTLVTLELPNR